MYKKVYNLLLIISNMALILLENNLIREKMTFNSVKKGFKDISYIIKVYIIKVYLMAIYSNTPILNKIRVLLKVSVPSELCL